MASQWNESSCGDTDEIDWERREEREGGWLGVKQLGLRRRTLDRAPLVVLGNPRIRGVLRPLPTRSYFCRVATPNIWPRVLLSWKFTAIVHRHNSFHEYFLPTDWFSWRFTNHRFVSSVEIWRASIQIDEDSVRYCWSRWFSCDKVVRFAWNTLRWFLVRCFVLASCLYLLIRLRILVHIRLFTMRGKEIELCRDSNLFSSTKISTRR